MKNKALKLSRVMILPAHMDSLEPLVEFVARTGLDLGIEDSVIPKLKLAAEELLVNVVRYAYAESGGNGDIEVRCGMADTQTFCMAILDKGMPFNPLEAGLPDLTEDIDHRPVGGLGVYLVKELADYLDYSRDNDTNVVLFCKSISSRGN